MNSKPDRCARGHVDPVWELTAASRECRDCRHLRQRSPAFQLTKRKTRRARANERDLDTIKELIAKWQE